MRCAAEQARVAARRAAWAEIRAAVVGRWNTGEPLDEIAAEMDLGELTVRDVLMSARRLGELRRERDRDGVALIPLGAAAAEPDPGVTISGWRGACRVRVRGHDLRDVQDLLARILAAPRRQSLPAAARLGTGTPPPQAGTRAFARGLG